MASRVSIPQPQLVLVKEARGRQLTGRAPAHTREQRPVSPSIRTSPLPVVTVSHTKIPIRRIDAANPAVSILFHKVLPRPFAGLSDCVSCHQRNTHNLISSQKRRNVSRPSLLLSHSSQNAPSTLPDSTSSVHSSRPGHGAFYGLCNDL